MMQRVRERLPAVLPGAAEGAASAAVLGYGPLYMRQVLGEPRLSVTTLMLAIAALVWFLAAAGWGRLGDRVRQPLALAGWTLLLSGLVQAALPVAATSAAFIMIVVVWSCLLAAIAPLSVSWLTVRDPDHPAEEAAAFYRMRSVGWTIGSMGTSLLVGLLDLAGITWAFQAGGAMSVALAAAVLAILRDRTETGPPRAAGHNPPAGAAAGVQAEPSGWPGPGPEQTDSGAAAAGPDPVPGRAPGLAGPIWRFHAVATLTAIILLTTTGNEAFFAVLGPYLTEYLAGSLEHIGLSMGVASLLGIIITGPLGRLADRWGAERVLVTGCLGYVAMYGLVVLWRHPVATVVLYGLPLFPFMSAGATGTLSRRTPAARRAEAIGVYEGTSALAAAVGSVLGGFVADAAGLPWVPVISLALAVGGCVVAWARLRPGVVPPRARLTEAPLP